MAKKIKTKPKSGGEGPAQKPAGAKGKGKAKGGRRRLVVGLLALGLMGAFLALPFRGQTGLERTQAAAAGLGLPSFSKAWERAGEGASGLWSKATTAVGLGSAHPDAEKPGKGAQAEREAKEPARPIGTGNLPALLKSDEGPPQKAKPQRRVVGKPAGVTVAENLHRRRPLEDASADDDRALDALVRERAGHK